MSQGSADTLTLCANERLARALREDHSLARRAAGAQVWEAPRIASLQRWAIDVWTQSWPVEQLLHPVQELALWCESIEADEAGAQLLAIVAAAREARRSDQLLRRHLLDLDRGPAWTAEHQAFRRWRRQVQRRLAQRAWVTAADVPMLVARHLREGRIAAPASVQLCGFVEPPAPAERALLQALTDGGASLNELPLPLHAARIRKLKTADPDSQFRAIAFDIRERLRPYADHLRPPPRLILALPDVDASRERIEARFGEVLAPWSAVSEGARLLPWRFESPGPLAEHPWIDAALAVAELEEEGNAPALLSRLLLSAALWNEEERAAAAAADYALRDAGWPQPRLARLLTALPPLLRGRFEKFAACMRTAPRLQFPSGWAQALRARLAALGWPGSAPLDSAAFQAVREFERVLGRLSAMDAQLGPVNWTTARLWLSELARSAGFDPRAEHVQPIQIMRLDEALGLSCDVLYIADTSLDKVPGPRPNHPYLPNELLVLAKLPEASPQAHLEQAQKRLAHLLAGAPDVMLSCAEVDERGAALSPSPLFGDTAQWSRHAPQRLASATEKLAAAGPHLSWPEDDPVPAMDADEHSRFSAGAELFGAWFESPFFAFARYRLGVQPLPRPGHGLDPRKQGSLAHAVLQDIWGEVAGSEALAAITDPDLRARLAERLDAYLPRFMPTADFGKIAVRLERERQLEVLAQWLAHERRRVEGFVVAMREEKIAVDVGGLRLSLRIDRIDRVETSDGPRWLVIDYKTGREARPNGWNAERLSEPQLPLYASAAVRALALIPQVDGICFAHLKEGHPAFVALSNWRQHLIDPEAGRFHPDWTGQLAQWQTRLETAAHEFLAGVAWLSDKVGERSRYAELLPLARRGAEDDET